MMISDRPNRPVGMRLAMARLSQRQLRLNVRKLNRDASAKCPELCAFIQCGAYTLCREQFVAKSGQWDRIRFSGEAC